ncbi:MAG: ATP-dependent DNA ligase [Thermoplasmatota archaeon]
MLYNELCEFYERIGKTSKRLEMTDELISLFNTTPLDDIETVVRLTKGEVRPDYEGIDLGIAEKLALKALYTVTMLPMEDIEKEMVRTGDIGLAGESVISKKRQTALFHEPLTVKRVFSNMERIASSEGRSSQDLKLKLIADLLHDASPIESKYILRTMCQKMRIGTADMTMVDALAYLITDEMDLVTAFIDQKGIELNRQVMEGLLTRNVLPLNRLYESASPKAGMDQDLSKQIRELIDRIKKVVQENRERIVRAYNIHPDLGFLARSLMENGIGVLDSINISPGVPLKSMLGERLPSMEGILEKMGGEAALEYKYDGLRIQVHIKESGDIVLFSRQMENITGQFPDIVSSVGKKLGCSSSIVEGEAVPLDTETGRMLPFQVISQRRGRKYDLEQKVEEIPVLLVLFDCLYLGGRDLTKSPYTVRRNAISEVFPGIREEISGADRISLSRMEIIRDPDSGEIFFQKALEDGCEGIMAKSTSDTSIYQAGSRGWLWIKLKKDYQSELSDTLDLVVVGAYHGTGRRGGTYGALLMASYDPQKDEYETVCKLGSGFNDEHLSKLPGDLSDLVLLGDKPHERVNARMKADVYFEPSLVLEIKGAEVTFSPVHTCAWGVLKENAGLAVRFPRFTGRFRSDKGPDEATTTDELISMYKQQVKKIQRAKAS